MFGLYYAVAVIESGVVLTTTKSLDQAAELLKPGRCWAEGKTRSDARKFARHAAKKFRLQLFIERMNRDQITMSAAISENQYRPRFVVGGGVEDEAASAMSGVLGDGERPCIWD